MDSIRVGVFDPAHPEFGVGAYFTSSEWAQKRAETNPNLIYFQIFKYNVDPDEVK